MATKCPKCGGELIQTTPEIAKCKGCGAAFKRKAPVESEGIQKKGTGKKAGKAKNKGKHKILKTVAIVVFGIGVLGAMLPDADEKDGKTNSKGSSSNEENSVWAKEDTPLDDFEYYVDGNKIHITGYNGKDEKLKIGREYDVDGTKESVSSISDAPFIFSGLESIIVSEGVETLDETVFNSCEAKYIFIPSTITNVEDKFWDYFFQVDRLYYGGTQEQWDSICKVSRGDIDCKQIYCNVKEEELGKSDSGKQAVSMQSQEDNIENENSNTEEDDSIWNEENNNEQQVENTTEELSESDFKASCIELNYEEVMRNPGQYEGQNCIVSGTVDQIIEGWFDSFSIFIIDPSGNKWGCTYFYKENETHLLEGDSVTVYGECSGTDTTKTILGQQVTMPRVEIEYIR